VRIGLTFTVRQANVADRLPDSSIPGVPARLPPPVAAQPVAVLDPFAAADDQEEEFDSPATIEALADAVRSLGHEVDLLGDGETMLRRLLDGPRPDLVLNIAEGRGGGRSREARVPAVLEMLGIPCTGSDPLTLAVTLDKDCTKRLIRDAGIATPAWVLFEGDYAAVADQLASLPMPLIVKPAFEGSSKGVLSKSVVRDRAELRDTLHRVYEVYHQPVLVEEFIVGDELTVGVLGNRPPQVLGIMRVIPREVRDEPFVYSLEVKRDWERLVKYECPAKLSAADIAAVEQATLACWRTLGCRDVSRFDFRLRDGVPYFLEVNPLPGLSPKSGDLVFIARFMGLEHPQLIARILQAAIQRHQL
jgi:D-alanine-D-alanine ligase